MAEDNILDDFFSEAAKMEIKDDGFTDRVMHELKAETARRLHRLSRIWSVTCTVVGIVFAVWSGLLRDAAQLLATYMRALTTYDFTHINHIVLIIPTSIAIVVAIYGIVENERLSDVSYP